MMRIVALEEHLNLPHMRARVPVEAIRRAGWPDRLPAHMDHTERLQDLGAGRLAAMDQAGITLQVLSVSGVGADLLSADEGPAFAREYNDTVARAVAGHPQRFAAFAHLPMTHPQAAADELQRCVERHGFRGALINGTTEGRFLDDARFEPLLARAEALNVPLYLHPNLVPAPVREAYYGGLPDLVGYVFSMAGWGWHAETAVHVVRLVLAGTLERHRGLRLIVGHMGEGLPMMLARFDTVVTPLTRNYLSRTVSETILQQVWITTSGFFSLPPFMAALLSFGADRILFSVDYPYAPNSVARAFLDQLPVAPADKLKIAHGNADALLGLQRGDDHGQ
jgi:predicted TIM-barrel fold metal-dependent hydrolase